MFKFLKSVLSETDVNNALKAARKAVQSGNEDKAWESLAPVIGIQSKQRAAAIALLQFIDEGHLSADRSLTILNDIEAAYTEDIEIISKLGHALEEACEINFLNRPAPDHPLFQRVTETLSKAARDDRFSGNQSAVLQGLATAARMAGRKGDDATEKAYKRLIELEPDNSSRRYGYGLFLKTRGRFREGLEQNKKAIELAADSVDAYEWNFGICATGAGDGQAALGIWKSKGNNLELGRFDLPEGRYPQCKVRLAERPLAERSAENDDPGLEETVWIERLSPCHGIIRSVLYQILGVNYGDVVLFDGAPVTYHKNGDEDVAVFPHLATLKCLNYQFFDFAGTQTREREIMEKSAALPFDAVIYSHSEQYQTLCATCWKNPDIDHEAHRTTEKHVVVGKVAAPPSIDPVSLLESLDGALADTDGCSIYIPSLCQAAGENQRATVEQRRFSMLVNN